jgi:hypothetical protein
LKITLFPSHEQGYFLASYAEKHDKCLLDVRINKLMNEWKKE